MIVDAEGCFVLRKLVFNCLLTDFVGIRTDADRVVTSWVSGKLALGREEVEVAGFVLDAFDNCC